MTAIAAVSAAERWAATAGTRRRGTFWNATGGLATALAGGADIGRGASNPDARKGVWESVGSGRSVAGSAIGAGGAGATSSIGAADTRTAPLAGLSKVTSKVGGTGWGEAGSPAAGGDAAGNGASTMFNSVPVTSAERSKVTVLPS